MHDSAECWSNDRQSQVIEIQDQRGCVHKVERDKLGRLTQDRVTTLGSGVDGAVRRLQLTYNPRGHVATASSYDNATVGSGSIVNQVQMAYNAFGQLSTEYQSHSGAVDTGTTPKIQYAFTDGSANHVRPTTMTYPSSQVLNYDYGAANGNDDAASRIALLKG